MGGGQEEDDFFSPKWSRMKVGYSHLRFATMLLSKKSISLARASGKRSENCTRSEMERCNGETRDSTKARPPMNREEPLFVLKYQKRRMIVPLIAFFS
jgi:hypothetical protein